MIHTKESLNNTAWNNWNFTSAHMFIDLEEGFYFKNSTDLLFETAQFVIGNEYPHLKIKMKP